MTTVSLYGNPAGRIERLRVFAPIFWEDSVPEHPKHHEETKSRSPTARGRASTSIPASSEDRKGKSESYASFIGTVTIPSAGLDAEGNLAFSEESNQLSPIEDVLPLKRAAGALPAAFRWKNDTYVSVARAYTGISTNVSKELRGTLALMHEVLRALFHGNKVDDPGLQYYFALLPIIRAKKNYSRAALDCILRGPLDLVPKNLRPRVNGFTTDSRKTQTIAGCRGYVHASSGATLLCLAQPRTVRPSNEIDGILDEPTESRRRVKQQEHREKLKHRLERHKRLKSQAAIAGAVADLTVEQLADVLRDSLAEERIAQLASQLGADINKQAATTESISRLDKARDEQIAELTRQQVFGMDEPSVEGLRQHLKNLAGSKYDSLEQKRELCRIVNYWKSYLESQTGKELEFTIDGQPCTLSPQANDSRGVFRVRAVGAARKLLKASAAFPKIGLRHRK